MVSITGSGFVIGTTGTTVNFGSSPATSVNCSSTDACSATSPSSSPGIVDITATVGGQTSADSLADEFDYDTFAYVPNFDDGTVSVIDTATQTVPITVNVGMHPDGVAVTPNGRFAYVSNSAANDVSVIDTSTNTVTATIGVGSNPDSIAISPNGVEAYVANSGSDNVSVINTSTNTVTTTIDVGADPVGVIFNSRRPDRLRDQPQRFHLERDQFFEQHRHRHHRRGYQSLRRGRFS